MKPKSYKKLVDRMINRWGEDIIHYKKITIITDVDLSEEYWAEPVLIKGQVSQLTGWVDTYEMFGKLVVADYLITFKTGTDVSTGDKLKVKDDFCIITEKVSRSTAGVEDFIECLARRTG